MTNYTKVEVMNIVENFLMDTPNPINEDWKRLIEAHPDHAKDIADAAIFQSSFSEINDEEDMVFDQRAYDSSVSRVLNLVYQMPSPDLLTASQKLESIKGPKQIKCIVKEIGIGPYPVLLNGILAGRILAPSAVLASLSNFLELPITLLTQVIQSKFEQSVVPSFKSIESKPELKTKPTNWKEAVRSLELSEVETVRLLKLVDEDDE
jgi:hypothetical protein